MDVETRRHIVALVVGMNTLADSARARLESLDAKLAAGAGGGGGGGAAEPTVTLTTDEIKGAMGLA